MKEEKNACESLYGSRCTRSRAAPDWTLTESLTLVNEIAVVEADCSTALSSYQQWKIIAENCAVLDVARGLNQCRTKWNSLLAEYTKIKAWQSKSPRNSYWSLESQRAKKFGLPENFDHELFDAIDVLVKARNERSGTDTGSDFEVETEELDDDDVTEEIGSKRKRREFKSKRHAEKHKNSLPDESLELSKGRAQRDCDKERPKRSQELEKKYVKEDNLKDLAGEKANSKHTQERPSKVDLEVSEKSLAKGKLQEAQVKERPSKTCATSEAIDKEENDEMLALKLLELAEQVKATSAETAECRTDCSQNVEAYRTEFTRRQGDKLIASLGDFADTLKQLCNLLQECK